MRYLIAILALFSLSASPSCWRNGWIEGQGDGGSVQGIGRAAAFVPVVHAPRSVGFVYGRGLIEGDRNYEGDLGVGFRAVAGCAAVGMYGFYDVRRTHRQHFYQEVAVGADLYLPKWEARFNGYIPLFGHDNHGTQRSVAIIDNTPILTETVQGALYGFNAETGPHLFLCRDGRVCPEVRVLVGGYYFRRSNTATLGGYRARFEVSFNPLPDLIRALRFSFGGTFQRDRIQAGKWFFYGRLAIPFGTLCRTDRCCDPCPCGPCAYLYHRIDRMDMVTLDTRRVDPTAILFKGRPVETIVTVTAATPDVPAAAAAAGDNSLVMVDGSIGLTSTIMQPTGQTIAGGGAVLPVTLPGGVPALATLPGAPGALSNAAALTLIDMSPNGTIFDLALTGTAPATGLVTAMMAPDAMILQSAVTTTGGTAAVEFADSDRASIMDSTFSLASTDGVVLLGGTDNAIVDSIFTGSAVSVIGARDAVGTAIQRNQVSTSAAGSVGIGFDAPGIMSTEKNYTVTGNLVSATRTVVLDMFTDGAVRGNLLMATGTGVSVAMTSGFPGAQLIVEGNTIVSPTIGVSFNDARVVVNGNTINGATTDVMATANSTLSGTGNIAVPFTCMDGGGNTGVVFFNNGTDSCP